MCAILKTAKTHFRLIFIHVKFIMVSNLSKVYKVMVVTHKYFNFADKVADCLTASKNKWFLELFCIFCFVIRVICVKYSVLTHGWSAILT